MARDRSAAGAILNGFLEVFCTSQILTLSTSQISFSQALVAKRSFKTSETAQRSGVAEFVLITDLGWNQVLQFGLGSMRHRGLVFQLNAKKWTLQLNKLARAVGSQQVSPPVRHTGISQHVSALSAPSERLPTQHEATLRTQLLTCVSRDQVRYFRVCCRAVFERLAALRFHPGVPMPFLMVWCALVLLVLAFMSVMSVNNSSELKLVCQCKACPICTSPFVASAWFLSDTRPRRPIRHFP